MSTRIWDIHRVKFEDLKKALDSCSLKGMTIYNVFISTALKGYYEIVAFKDNPPPVIP